MSTTISYSPKVCMDPKVHYTTQSSAYDRLLVGKRLTNRIIANRMREGYYEKGGILFAMKEKTKEKLRMTKGKRKRTIAEVLEDFDV